LYVGKDSANTYLASLIKVKESTFKSKKSKKSEQVKNLKWLKMREVRKSSSPDVDNFVNKPLWDNDLENRSRMMKIDSKLNNPTIYGILKNVVRRIRY
jgi:hypothetical protein